MRGQAITYHSEDVPLAGTLSFPDSQKDERLPALILLPGYIASQKVALPATAEYFTGLGYATLALDYRGFGKSGGTRWRLICDERVLDTRMAITWLSQQAGIDADRIGIYGSSFGGSIAVKVAAADPRVKVIVCVGAPSDGESWIASQRSWPHWLIFRKRVLEDERRRVNGEPGEWVSFRDDYLPSDDPVGAAFTAAHHAADPDYYGSIPLESARSLMDCKPVEVVHLVAPRPILIIHGEGDPRVPLSQAIDLYNRASEPKRLSILKGATHYDVTNPGPRFHETLGLSGEWFEKHLRTPRSPYHRGRAAEEGDRS